MGVLVRRAEGVGVGIVADWMVVDSVVEEGQLGGEIIVLIECDCSNGLWGIFTDFECSCSCLGSRERAP